MNPQITWVPYMANVPLNSSLQEWLFRQLGCLNHPGLGGELPQTSMYLIVM